MKNILALLFAVTCFLFLPSANAQTYTGSPPDDRSSADTSGALLASHLVETQVEQDSIEASSDVMVPFRAKLIKAGYRHQVPAALLAGVLQVESGGDPWAERSEPAYMKNRKIKRLSRQWSNEHGGLPTALTEQTDRSKSMGLMQVMGEKAREQGYYAKYLSSLFDPDSAIDQGATLLHTLLTRYGRDTLAAISAYNQGNARKTHGAFDNAQYVYKVCVARRHYEKAFKHGYSTQSQRENGRHDSNGGAGACGLMVRASFVRQSEQSSIDTALGSRDTLGEGTDRHRDTARYGAIKGGVGVGTSKQLPPDDRSVSPGDAVEYGQHEPWGPYVALAAVYLGVLGYFSYGVFRDGQLARRNGDGHADNGHALGVLRDGDGLLHG